MFNSFLVTGFVVLSFSAHAEVTSCLTKAIINCTEKFKATNVITQNGQGPVITAKYLNRNLYDVTFEYTVREGDSFISKKAIYQANSDYAEEFNPMNDCTINSSREL